MASMEVQSLIFSKDSFSRAEAVKWARDHDFSSSGVDETEESYRIRQQSPGRFKTMRTISMTEGVKAVVGKSAQGVLAAERTEAVMKALHPDAEPTELMAQILMDNDGYLGGTIRYGSGDGSARPLGSDGSSNGSREKFVFGDLTFDVDAAKELCGGIPNDEIEVSDAWSHKINVDKVAAMESTSQNPCIVAQMPTRRGFIPLLIDGHHRMFKARSEDRKTFPAYVLTPEQTLFIIETHPDMMETLTKCERDLQDRARRSGKGTIEKIARIWHAIIEKAQPGGSDVHVPTPGSETGEEEDTRDAEQPTGAAGGEPQVLEEPGWVPPPQNNRSVKIERAFKKRMKKIKKEMKLDIEGALAEVSQKDELEIENDAASSWTSRAIAVFILAAGAEDDAQRFELLDWGDDLYHEALEHGSLVKDNGKTVAQVQSAIEPYRAKVDKIEKAASGIMVCLYVPSEVAEGMAMEGGEPAEDLHVTLAYIPNVGQDETAFAAIVKCIEGVARQFAPVGGCVGGTGLFNASEASDGKDVYYASFNAPVLPALQQAVVSALDWGGIEISRRHGFTPHITLKYCEPGSGTLGSMSTPQFRVPAISVASNTIRRVDIPLTGTRITKEARKIPLPKGEVPIFKTDGRKQIAYGVVLEPDTEDSQGDVITAEEIEKTAHDYLENSRRAGDRHKKLVEGVPVESYIAPMDMEFPQTPDGPQLVKKGSWIVGMKYKDPAHWHLIETGQRRGFSVGGHGVRD